MSIWTVSIGMVTASVVASILTTVTRASDVEFSGYFLSTLYGSIDLEGHPETGTNHVLVNQLEIHPFWSFRQEKQGWIIYSLESLPPKPQANQTCKRRHLYLSYRTNEAETKQDPAASMTYVSDVLNENAYWQIEFSDPKPIDGFTLYAKPAHGEFTEWYLSPAERIGVQPRELTLRRIKDWVKMSRSESGNRTIRNSSGSLSIEGRDRRIVFQKNTSGFHGIWTLQQGQQGWWISSRLENREPAPKLAYLSYSQKKPEQKDGDLKLTDTIFFSESPQENSFWEVDIVIRSGNDFDCYIRPKCGDFAGWYLTTGDELSEKTTPLWKKKSSVIFSREKPEKPLNVPIDGA